MRTRVSHPKVGPPTSTPNITGTPVGQEVQGPVSATIVAGAVMPTVITPDPGAVAAAKAFREGFRTLLGAFAQHLLTPPLGYVRRGKVSARRSAAIPRLATMLRIYPSLAPSSPDAMVADAVWADAMDMVAADLQNLLLKVEDTARLVRSDAWHQANAVYIAAEHQAKTDSSLETWLAPVRDLLSRGSRIDTAAASTGAAAHKAAKAQARTTDAQQRALVASQSQTRTVQAHVARHPTRAVPVPASVYQGPAVTTPADAASNQGPAPTSAATLQGPAVNPQGPASGR